MNFMTLSDTDQQYLKEQGVTEDLLDHITFKDIDEMKLSFGGKARLRKMKEKTQTEIIIEKNQIEDIDLSGTWNTSENLTATISEKKGEYFSDSQKRKWNAVVNKVKGIGSMEYEIDNKWKYNAKHTITILDKNSFKQEWSYVGQGGRGDLSESGCIFYLRK
jgi:phosphoribosyl-AMP cyclohydrolase